MLSAEHQERYARHLLLDDFGGDAQERLLAGAVVVRLPAEAAQAARWAVRYLASSGVGTLVLDGPWAEEAAAEARRLAPQAAVSQAAAAPAGLAAVTIELAEEGGLASPGLRLALDPARALDPSSAAALGAQAAVEAVKLLADAGLPAPRPLRAG